MERVGEAFELDERLTILGRQLRVGDLAPDFVLESFGPETQSMRVARLGDTSGQVRLLNVVNSVDTPVCHIETRRRDGLREDLPPEVVLFTISMDLPFAQARWRSAERVGRELLSAHKDEGFGQAYGVLVKEWPLLQRAVFGIDRGTGSSMPTMSPTKWRSRTTTPRSPRLRQQWMPRRPTATSHRWERQGAWSPIQSGPCTHAVTQS